MTDPTMTTYRLRWEMVSAITHPQYYVGERFAADVAGVPDEHWYEVTATSPDEARIRQQVHGLRALAGGGEAIRNIRVEQAATPPPEFSSVDW